jgi:ComF family protein
MVYEWLRRGLKQALLRALPFNCTLCGQGAADADMDLCASCRRHLPWLEQACRCCANPLAARTVSLLCGRCLLKPPHFDRSYCAFVYREPVSWLLQGLKYHRRLSGIPVASRLLLDHLRSRVEFWPQLILPIPLHPARLRQRGFNQALEIARPLARALRIPLSVRLCGRERNTPQQSELPATRRAANVHNAFRMYEPLPVKHVAIVDDIVTTGATANELARLLKRNGAETVQVWAVARTPIAGNAKK